jgi:glycosyltransferase involved in cell wall biosynthesis
VNRNSSLVSICIPTYNSERYIRQCLDSIVAQTYKNVEVIISDNASTDDTLSIVSEFVNRNGYKLNINSVNIGAGANFNKVLSLSNGEYVSIYHADDVYENTIVEESVRVLDNDETVGLVGTMGIVIDKEGNYLHDLKLHEEVKKLNKNIFDFDEALWGATKNIFVTPSIMVRKKVYDELGTFEIHKYKSAVDYEMWLRIATKYKVAIIDKKLINYRVHENQGSEHEVRKNIEIPDIISVLKEYRHYLSNDLLKKYCNDIINKWLIKAAKKQNYFGYYEKSNVTLSLVESNRYYLLKVIFRVLNLLKISLKKRRL